ncbi:patatin-like phospholipase family protein [Hyalangium gracile]|uniref:patatin-like phospholipase family protein n=1 Tax=Hyalangium gracile TaxID=394092 RepID=UPI001CCA39BE|nr:patatin-like phospholipase family protein [Hyalangium gracile]
MSLFDVAGKVDVLKAAPALAGFLREQGSEAALQALAERLVPSDVEAGTALETRAPAVRFLVSGLVQVRRQGRLLPGNAQDLGMGSVHGLEAVARWLDPRAPAGSSAALVVAPTQFLELRERDFGKVPRPLLEWLGRVHRAGLLAEDIVLALGEEPRFANVPGQFLFRLVESASVVDGDAQTLMQRGRVPTDFYLLLSGTCQILRSGECLAVLRGSAAIGHKHYLLGKPMAGDAVLDRKGSRTVVVRIDGTHFRQLLQKDPDFRRSVYRGNPELSPPPAPPAAHQILVLDSREPLALRLLGERLAERLAVHLQEHVLVLRVTKREVDLREPPSFRRPTGTVNGWVAELSRPLVSPGESQGSRLLPRPEAFAWRRAGDRLAGSTNVTLVDVSELPASERRQVLDILAQELAPWPDEPLKLVYLASAPEGFPPTNTLPDRVQLVPTGILSPEVPVGLGTSLREVTRRRSIAERVKAARQVAASAREMARAMRSHLGQLMRPVEQRPTWPMGTARVRFPADWNEGVGPMGELSDEQPELRETFDRWARAVTDRRIGLALGGGGAFGYVHLALLARMLEGSITKGEHGTQVDPSQRIPVDMVSGSSFGTVVGAFYSAAGTRGLELMQTYWPLVAAAFPLAVVSSLGVQWWLDAILGPVKLDQLEVPLFPVVVDSDAGVEWDVRQGTIGYGIRASGSFPPVMGPTLLGNRRLLDGGFVANVPVNVLRAEGADLLIASNPIPRLRPRGRRFSRFPLMRSFWNQVDPRLRVEDSFRMLTLIGRAAGESQISQADQVVVYSPKYNSATMFGLDRAREIVDEAEDSLELGQALLEVRALWRSRLNNPVSLVQWREEQRRVDLNELVFFTETGIEPLCQRTVLAELVDFLQQRKDITSFQVVATAGTREEAQARARLALEHLIAAGVPQSSTLTSAGRVMEGFKGAASRVSLEQVETAEVEAAYAIWLDNALRERKDVLRKALVDAQVRRLQLELERLRGKGDPELLRLLALEIARLDRSSETDRLLRAVLDHRGLLVRRFDSKVAATALAWSLEGQRIAVGYKDGSLVLYDVTRQEPLCTVDAHPGGSDPQVSHLAWSPDGRLLASSGSDSGLILWETSPEGLTPRNHGSVGTWDQWGLAFSPTGAHLLAAGHTYGPEENRSAAAFPLGKKASQYGMAAGLEGVGHVEKAAWAPEPAGLRFATVGRDEVHVWKVGKAGLEKLQSFPFPGARVLAWSPDASALLVGGTQGARILRPGAGSEPLVLETHGLGVGQVAWTRNGQLLGTLPDRGELHVWDALGRLMTVLRVEGEGAMQQILPNPKQPELALTWGGDAACVWDIASSRQLAWLGGHSGLILQAGWSPDGKHVATASVDGSTRVWAPTEGGPVRCSWKEFTARKPHGKSPEDFHWPAQGVKLPLPAEGRLIWGVFHPQLRQAALPVRNPSSKRWELRPWSPGEPLPKKWEEGWFENVYVHWSPDGSRVALREEGRLSIWDAKTWKLIAEHMPHGLLPTQIAWHPSGKRLALGRWVAWGGSVMLWNPEQEDGQTFLGGEESDGTWNLAWNPRGDVLAVACNDSRVRLYSVGADGPSEGGPVLTLQHWYPIKHLAWNPTGALLATGDESGAVALWDTNGDDLIASGQHRRHPIDHLSWSSDGTTLFSADDVGRAHLWRPAGEEWVTSAVLDSETTRLLWGAFTEDGKWVAAMGRDAKLRLHPVDFETLAGCVEALPGRKELTARERTRYVTSSRIELPDD